MWRAAAGQNVKNTASDDDDDWETDPDFVVQYNYFPTSCSVHCKLT